MEPRDLSTTRSAGATATSSAAPLQVARAELDRYHRLAEAARAGIGDWRTRLRVTAYALYRCLEEDECPRILLGELRSAGEWPASLVAAEIEVFSDLIDEGRALPTAPASLTRVTAEALGGAIFNQLYFAAARQGPRSAAEQLVPRLMYAAVLPYVGATAAAEELRIPPPPAGYPLGRGREAR